MGKHKLQPLLEMEKKLAEENHNLVYSFLQQYGYSIEEYYNVAIFGFLKGIQKYSRIEDLRKKYQLAFICNQHMRSECRNYWKMKNSQKRKPVEEIISLDAEYSENDNLYNCICGKSLETEIIEIEELLQLLENLSDKQRKIAVMKMDGYRNKEIYSILEIRPSTYYKEVKRIKAVLLECLEVEK